MRNVAILLAVLAVVAMAVPAQGELYFTTWTNAAGDNDYHNNANWDTDIGSGGTTHLAPPATDDGNRWWVYIYENGADYAEITGGSYIIEKFNVAYWGIAGKAVLDSGTSGTFNAGQFYIGTGDGGGEFIQNSGNVTVGPTYLGADNGNNPFLYGWAEYTISGGTFSGGFMGVASTKRAYYGLFKVVGSDSTITVAEYEQHPIGAGKGTGVLSLGGNLEAVLVGGGNGVTVISVTGDATLSGTLHVDVTGYTGSQTVIDILTADGTLVYKNHTNMYDPIGDSGVNPGDDDLIAWPDLVLDDASIAAGYTLGDDGNGTLQVTIPEPATMVLLTVGGIGLLIRRKRR